MLIVSNWMNNYDQQNEQLKNKKPVLIKKN